MLEKLSPFWPLSDHQVFPMDFSGITEIQGVHDQRLLLLHFFSHTLCIILGKTRLCLQNHFQINNQGKIYSLVV